MPPGCSWNSFVLNNKCSEIMNNLGRLLIVFFNVTPEVAERDSGDVERTKKEQLNSEKTSGDVFRNLRETRRNEQSIYRGGV
jgi:hypothetical protein